MRTVFLDLDGTLTDSGPGIVNSVDFALKKMGLPPLTGDTSWLVGPPLWGSFEKLGVKKQELDRAVAFYRERYADIGWSENSLYPGILDQLSTLRRAGYTLCLATSKAHSYGRKITAHFGISEYLSYEFGSELDGTRSDKTSLLAHGLKTAGAEADHAIMVGDRHYDAVGAKANRMRVIGVAYGYGSEAELSKAEVDDIIASPLDLAEAVLKILPPED